VDADVASAAALFADRTRADVVAALLDGRALTAGELARSTGVSASTVSTHLRRLLEGGLLAVETQGRHRYYRLADEAVGRAFESLAALAPPRPVRSLRQSRTADALRAARTCYDHLAGQAGVRLTDALLDDNQAGLLVRHGRRAYALGEKGAQRFKAFGIDVVALQRKRRSFAHPCLDWSERRHHLAGALGAAVLDQMFALGWVSRLPDSRAVRIEDAGQQGLLETFACDLEHVA
jgi:DNA-binding transcriptional ArsR family regulator